MTDFRKKPLNWLALLIVSIAAAPQGRAETTASNSDDETLAELYQPRTLDGVTVEAVETYLSPKDNEFNLGAGFYPFNSYYNGMSVNAGYTYNINRAFAWEIVNASYIYTFDKGLTAELADKHGVEPRSIERLRFSFSSNIGITHSNGKLIFASEHVRYFRSSVLIGGGMLNTSQRSMAAANIGLRFEVFTGQNFAWKLDVRNSIAIPDFEQFVSFSLGTGFSF
jgi:outer membrane beta-barrel protein